MQKKITTPYLASPEIADRTLECNQVLSQFVIV